RGAGKSSRAANCPPSYPPYTLSHTLARNHPYPPLPPRPLPPHFLLSFAGIFHRSSLLSCLLPAPSTRIARVSPSFLRSVLKHHTAILINALTLPLHNYACPLE
ncbi:hypothetical protein ALC62_14885, partial [Cyphomyrmex costatus]